MSALAKPLLDEQNGPRAVEVPGLAGGGQKQQQQPHHLALSQSAMLLSRFSAVSQQAQHNIRARAVADAVRSRGSTCGMKQRLSTIVHGIVRGPDPLFTPPGVHAAEACGAEEGWTRRYRSGCADRIMCLVCLRTHPECCSSCCRTNTTTTNTTTTTQETPRPLSGLLLPVLYCGVIFAAWGVVIWTLQSIEPMQGVGDLQLALHACTYVMGALGHAVSTVLVVKASHDATFRRHYFLPSTTLPPELQERSDTIICRWGGALSVATSFVFVLFIVLCAISPTNSLHERLHMYTIGALLVLSVNPQIVLQGLLDARVTDLTENMVCFSVLAQQTFERRVSDAAKFHELLETTRKMVGIVQAFSWDWEKAILGALASPVAITLIFAFNIASVLGKIVSAGIHRTSDRMLLYIFFLGAGVVLHFACFLSTMHKLSKVASAGYKLQKLVDYSLTRDHLKDEETARVVAEIRHLLHTRTVVKVMGGAVTPGFVLRLLRSLAKALSVAVGLLVTAGTSAATRTANSAGYNATATRL